MDRFYKGLMPWLAVVVGSTFFLQFFQRAKFQFKSQRQPELDYLGLTSDTSLDQLYKEMVEDEDSDNWENVRGPRIDEPNTEFEAAKARRQKEMEAKREKFRARREEFKRRLEQHQQK
uniref:Cytochrome c oxidase assembly protein COX16 homolog, mitochondrial n=1 Tax=Globodera rostochiensis TaxID=31243 RepID=A0A914HZL3_GLORO